MTDTTTACSRCQGSGEDPEGYYDQTKGDAGHTHDGPCRDCAGTGEVPTTANLEIDPVDNATGETMCRVRFFIETPAGWVGAHDKAALEYLIAARAQDAEPVMSPAVVAGLDNPEDADHKDNPNVEWYCEDHPNRLMGHEGCGGAGILPGTRILLLTNYLRLSQQEVREANRMRDDLVAQIRAARVKEGKA